MSPHCKQLLDGVFKIFRIIKVEVGITLTTTLIILDITKTESNNSFIKHCAKQKRKCFCFFTDGKQDKASEVDMITLRNLAPQSYMT